MLNAQFGLSAEQFSPCFSPFSNGGTKLRILERSGGEIEAIACQLHVLWTSQLLETEPQCRINFVEMLRHTVHSPRRLCDPWREMKVCMGPSSIKCLSQGCERLKPIPFAQPTLSFVAPVPTSVIERRQVDDHTPAFDVQRLSQGSLTDRRSPTHTCSSERSESSSRQGSKRDSANDCTTSRSTQFLRDCRPEALDSRNIIRIHHLNHKPCRRHGRAGRKLPTERREHLLLVHGNSRTRLCRSCEQKFCVVPQLRLRKLRFLNANVHFHLRLQDGPVCRIAAILGSRTLLPSHHPKGLP